MEKEKTPSSNGSNGRDEQGRFAKGNRGGPGNPYSRQVAALRCEMIAAITHKDIHEIFRALINMAKHGDVAAARLILGYAIGSLTAAPDPDTLDERELKNKANYYKEECRVHREKPSIVDRISSGTEN